MFKCLDCNSIDKIALMAAKGYAGKGNIRQKYNENNEIVICIDTYEFIPDLKFMNSHAACAWCGHFGHWEYCFDPSS